MKDGTTDPFATDEPDETDSTDTTTDGSDSPTQPVSSDTQTDSNRSPSGSTTSQFDRSDLPRIVTREKVKDDRDDVHQLFVYEDTAEKEQVARRELEDRLGDVYKLDAREAIYRAGMQNIDDAEAILREWGADI